MISQPTQFEPDLISGLSVNARKLLNQSACQEKAEIQWGMTES